LKEGAAHGRRSRRCWWVEWVDRQVKEEEDGRGKDFSSSVGVTLRYKN
jgi:hypothetical protein